MLRKKIERNLSEYLLHQFAERTTRSITIKFDEVGVLADVIHYTKFHTYSYEVSYVWGSTGASALAFLIRKAGRTQNSAKTTAQCAIVMKTGWRCPENSDEVSVSSAATESFKFA
jgi:hypothetical protein